jgi:transposase InsO family protein
LITTNFNHPYLKVQNELSREFTNLKLGENWVSNITYIWINGHGNYLTAVIDLVDKKVVGWALSEGMTT